MNLLDREDKELAVEPLGLLFLLIPLTLGVFVVESLTGWRNFWVNAAVVVALYLTARLGWRAAVAKYDL